MNKKTKQSTFMTPDGVRQPGTQKPNKSMFRAYALPTRAVVQRVYRPSDSQGIGVGGMTLSPTVTRCDVIAYGAAVRPIPRVLVTYPSAGLHEGSFRNPRPTSQAINNVDELDSTYLESIDGDHVIVDFLDGNLNEPYIAAYIAHPALDRGNDAKDVGQRLRLIPEDGEPAIFKHRGVATTIDTNGDTIFDSTQAHEGAYIEGREEHVDGRGHIVAHLPSEASITILIGESEVTISNVDGQLRVNMAGADFSAALAEPLQQLYAALKSTTDANFQQLVTTATVPNSTLGASGFIPQSLPDWDPEIASDVVKIGR